MCLGCEAGWKATVRRGNMWFLIIIMIIGCVIMEWPMKPKDKDKKKK